MNDQGYNKEMEQAEDLKGRMPYPMHFKLSAISALVAFSIVMFIVAMGDAIMSYVTPVFVQDKLNSSVWMGIIMATSSIVGIGCDIVFGEWFRGRKYTFFLGWTFVSAVLFALSFVFLPPIVPFFILSMALWGIYYELIEFANFHFVHAFINQERHAFAWGIMSTFKSIAYTIGPLLASFLLDKGANVPFFAAVGFYLTGMFALLLFLKTYHKKNEHVEMPHERKKSLLHELKVWRILGGRVWQLLVFMFMFSLIDATFWTTGTVLSEQMQKNGQPGELLLTLYTLPSLFVGVIAGVAARPFGKKRAAFLSAFMSGCVLFFAGIVTDSTALLILVFISSVFSALAFPEIMAVFADYVARLGPKGNDFIGMQSSSYGLSYIIGPILAGIISSFLGNQGTFAFVGGLVAVFSIVAFLIVPRKLKMPQSELSEV